MLAEYSAGKNSDPPARN